MSTVESATRDASVPKVAKKVDLKLEVVVIPVADVDRSKQFYERLGWRLDADFAFDNDFRVIQFTPPGSAASIQFGTKITAADPGSAQGLYLIVSDIEAAWGELARLGVEISKPFHPGAPGAQFAQDRADRLSGPASDHATYGSFATFSDPDGNAVAPAGGHPATSRSHRRDRDHIRIHAGPGERDAPRLGGPWRAREADGRRVRHELA